MNLSLFQSDGGLGNAAAYDPSGTVLRDVSIRITGDFVSDVPLWVSLVLDGAPLIFNVGKDGNGIQNLLNSKNWIIESVANESGWTGDYIFRLQAVVATGYTDGQIQDQLQADLAGFFTVTGISILTPQYTPPTYLTPHPPATNPVNYGGTTPPVNNPGGTQQPAGSGNVLGNLFGGSSNVAGNFAAGLGISTPVVLLAGGVLLLLLLKK